MMINPIHAKKFSLYLAKDAYTPVEGKEAYTHCVLTKEEYDTIRKSAKKKDDRITDLEYDLNELANKYNALVDEKEAIEADRDDKAQRIADYTANLQKLQKIAENTKKNKKTIEDVLEIVRERANKERGIKDKKNDPGYVIESTRWYHQRYYYNKKMWVWQTVITTPIHGDFDYNQFKEFWNADKKRLELFEKWGVGEYEAVDPDKSGFDTALEDKRLYYRMDEVCYPDAFWQVTIYHSKELIR